MLAACYAASLQWTVSLGPNAGRSVPRIGYPVDSAEQHRAETQQTLGHGFNLHAGLRVSARDRRGRARILSYILRPPIATQRLSFSPDGRVVYRLPRPWADGTRAFSFEPLDFLTKLLPLVPPPRVNQIRYHGVFAPHAKLRPLVVSSGGGAADEHGQLALEFGHAPKGKRHCRPIPWAELAARTFDIDVLECPRCGHRPMRVVSVVASPTHEQLLAAFGFQATASATKPHRARAPPTGQMPLPFLECAA